jgi:hypothetical protein
MAQVQNIKIKYTADTGDLTKAQKAIGNLTKAEKEAVKTVEDLNKKSKTATDTVSKGFDKAADSAEQLENKANAVKDVFASGFSIQSLKNLGSELGLVGKQADASALKFQKLKFAFAGLGLGAVALGFASVTTAMKTTETGADNMAKNLNRLKFLGTQVSGVLANVGNTIISAFTNFVGGTNAMNVIIDSITDGLDNLEEKTIDVGLANEKLSLESDKMLKSLRNRTLTYQEQISIIENIGLTEEKILNNNLALIQEEIQLRKNEILVYDAASKGKVKIAKDTIDKLISGEINLQEAITEIGDVTTSAKLQQITTLLAKEQQAFREKELVEVRIDNLKDQFTLQERSRLIANLSFKEQLTVRELKLNEYSERLKLAELIKINDEKLAVLRRFKDIEIEQNGVASDEILQQEKDLNLKRKELIKDFNKATFDLGNERVKENKKVLKEIELDETEFREELEKQYEKELAGLRQRQEDRVMIEDATAQAIQMITRGLFDAENDQRANQFDLLREQKERELADAGESAEKRKVIEQKFRQEEKMLRRQDAVAKKNQAMFEIALQTAINIAKALALPPTPGANITAAAVAGGLGAVQLGIAAARPIPAYKDGTKNHPGGLAVVGDGYKQEMILLPDGTVQLTPDKPTVMDLAKGAMVFPDAKDIDYNRLMANTTITATNETNMKLDKINHTLGNLTKLQVNIDEKGLNKFLIQNTTTTKILNNRYSI